MTNTFVLIPFLLGPRISILVNVQSSEQILWQPYLLLDTSHQLSSPLGGKVYHPQVLQLNSVIASTHVSSVSSVCGMMITGCIAAKDLRNIPLVAHGTHKTWTQNIEHRKLSQEQVIECILSPHYSGYNIVLQHKPGIDVSCVCIREKVPAERCLLGWQPGEVTIMSPGTWTKCSYVVDKTFNKLIF